MQYLQTLPECWWITPDITSTEYVADLLALFKRRVASGITHVQFRQTQLSQEAFEKIFSLLNAQCKAHNVTMIINGSGEQALQLNAAGCYLNSDQLMQCFARPMPENFLVGAYCHNLSELKHAEKINLDFVSLSPVQKTLTHPEQAPMGWETFQALASQTTLPVYALGGLSLNDKAKAIAHFGQGIMGIRFA